MKTLWHIYLGLLLLCFCAQCQIVFPTNTVCTNCPLNFPLPCYPLLTFDADRRVHSFGTTHDEYTLNAWQWPLRADTNQLHVYDANGVLLPASDEPNGEMNIGVTDAWAIQPNADGVKVGVIDTGVDGSLPEFQGVLDPSSDTADYTGHGTLICGIIAANSCTGFVGVARGATLIVRQSTLQASQVATQINELVNLGCKVINMSFGYVDAVKPTNVIEAMRAATNTIFHIPALNGLGPEDNSRDWLAIEHLPNTVCVTACNKSGTIYDAATGTNVLYAAPGRRILSVFANSLVVLASPPVSTKDDPIGVLRELRVATGTSLATPHSAGADALLCAKYPNETVTQRIERLTEGADKNDYWRTRTSSGGTLNAYRSLIFARSNQLTIGRDGVFAAGAKGTISLVESSKDLASWTFTTTTTNDGFPIYVAPVTNFGSRFYRISTL